MAGIDLKFVFEKRCLLNIHYKIRLFKSPQKQLHLDEGQNSLMKKVLDTYLLFFQINQSTTTLRHVFAALRLFVQKVQHPQCTHYIQTKLPAICFLNYLTSFFYISSSPAPSSRAKPTCAVVSVTKSSSAATIVLAPPRRRHRPCFIFS